MDQTKRNKLEAAGWTVADAEQFLSTDGYTTQDAIDHLLSDIELGEAEHWCRAIYHRNQHGFYPTDFHECHGIGERIEMQRGAAQRKEES